MFHTSFLDFMFFLMRRRDRLKNSNLIFRKVYELVFSFLIHLERPHVTLGSNKSAILLSTFSSSPFAYVDPLHCNMAYLYLELLKDSLNEYAYAAELAGLSYDLQNTIYGMYVSTHVLEPSTHQHFFCIDLMEAFLIEGMSLISFFNLYG